MLLLLLGVNLYCYYAEKFVNAIIVTWDGCCVIGGNLHDFYLAYSLILALLACVCKTCIGVAKIVLSMHVGHTYHVIANHPIYIANTILAFSTPHSVKGQQ